MPTRTVFLDASRDELHRRLVERNLDLPPGTFAIAQHELDAWAAHFEPPTEDELGAGATGPWMAS